LKSGEAVLKIADSPQGHGGAVTTHLVGDLHVGSLIVIRDPQDQATPEDQRLRGRVGAGENL
jgi:hypothetical protein